MMKVFIAMFYIFSMQTIKETPALSETKLLASDPGLQDQVRGAGSGWVSNPECTRHGLQGGWQGDTVLTWLRETEAVSTLMPEARM